MLKHKSLKFILFVLFLPILFSLKASPVQAATPGKVVNMGCHSPDINGLPGGATGCITYSPGSWAVRTDAENGRVDIPKPAQLSTSVPLPTNGRAHVAGAARSEMIKALRGKR